MAAESWKFWHKIRGSNSTLSGDVTKMTTSMMQTAMGCTNKVGKCKVMVCNIEITCHARRPTLLLLRMAGLRYGRERVGYVFHLEIQNTGTTERAV